MEFSVVMFLPTTTTEPSGFICATTRHSVSSCVELTDVGSPPISTSLESGRFTVGPVDKMVPLG